MRIGPLILIVVIIGFCITVLICLWLDKSDKSYAVHNIEIKCGVSDGEDWKSAMNKISSCIDRLEATPCKQ